MPIPLAQRQEFFKAPKVDTAKAVDPSQYMQGIAQAQMGAFQSVGKAAQTAMKVGLMQAQADEEQAAQDLFNKYIIDCNEEDLELSKHKNKDAVDYMRDHYYQNRNKSYAEALNRLNAIPNQQVREKYRQMMNEQNIKRHLKAQEYLFEEKTQWRHDTLATTQSLLSQEAHKSMLAGKADYNKTALDSSFEEAAIATRDSLKQDGYDDLYIDYQLRDLRNKFLVDAAEALSTRPDCGLRDATQLIHKYKGSINEDDYLKIARHYEEQYMRLTYADDPEKMITNGKYDDHKAFNYAPNLTEWERKQIVGSVKDSNKTGKLPGWAIDEQAQADERHRQNFFTEHPEMANYMEFVNGSYKLDGEALQKAIESGEMSLEAVARLYADGYAALQKQIKLNGLTFNIHSPEYRQKTMKTLDDILTLAMKHSKGNPANEKLFSSDYATMYSVAVGLIHGNYEKYRNENRHLFGLVGKRQLSYLPSEASTIKSALDSFAARGFDDKNFGDALNGDRDVVATVLAESVLKHDPRWQKVFETKDDPQYDKNNPSPYKIQLKKLKADFSNDLTKHSPEFQISINQGMTVRGVGNFNIPFLERQRDNIPNEVPTFNETEVSSNFPSVFNTETQQVIDFNK